MHGNRAEVFPVLGFAARFRKICKNKTLRLLGILPKLVCHIDVYVCIAIYAYAHTYLHIYMPICLHAYTAYIRTYLSTYQSTSTHAHTQIRTQKNRPMYTYIDI